jgi:acyl-coenzyme A synthetase/AMP-(fatty) acid ligase
MSSEDITLLGAVGQHPESPLLIHQDDSFTPSMLCEAALATRNTYPALAASSVALQFSSGMDLLLALIALDGYAREILLLPPCLAPALLAELVSESGVSHLLTENGLTVLAPEPAAKASGAGTKWLFTTSGTSGRPKVYGHTLQSLTVTTRLTRAPSRDIRWGLAYQPHRFAGIQVVLQALFSGAPLVIPPAIDINAMAASFARHRVNTLSATPSLWRNFLSQGALSRCPLRQITLGGEIADQAILAALGRAFPAARVVHIYASTEAGVGFSVADGKAGFPQEWLGQGPPLEMKISARGSLLIRSPMMSDSASLRSRLTPEGYLDTDDGVQVSNGRVHFLGRLTGVINVGGNKVHPEEVENLVREIPGVHNALVSARRSPLMGQLVVLEIQAGNLSAEESRDLKRRVSEHCRKHLPNYKVPALITIVQELAVSGAGKVERKQSA